MIKERKFSAHDDFNTALFCKVLFYIGCIFLFIFLITVGLSSILSSDSSGFLNQIYEFGKSEIPYTLLAISIILFVVSFIFYFLNNNLKIYQKFLKKSNIFKI